MKYLIVVVALSVALPLFANETESSWKASLRGVIVKIAGEEWGEKLLGPATDERLAGEIPMPEIPQQVKKATDVGAYSKKDKGVTEYDKLPKERKRQFDYNFLEELFMVTRKSEPRDEDLANWLNTLDQGGSREGIYQALVLDEVYAALENMDESPSQRIVDFTISFSQKYLKQTFKEESIADLNLYSLKRILTEKGLDLMEYYEANDLESLYSWYANLSADLAKDYPSILKSQVRQEPSAKYHYEWAKSMPLQHIKSEFIIKLHSVMNGLQLQE